MARSAPLLVVALVGACHAAPSLRAPRARAGDERDASVPGDAGGPELCSPWQGDGRPCELECLHGVSSSCMAAADRLAHGRGGDRDSARALSFYRRACEAGDASGCVQAARSVERGQGQRVDDDERRRLLDRACQLGAASACSALLRGHDGADREQAHPDDSRRALERACLAGNRAACEQIDGATEPSPIVEPR